MTPTPIRNQRTWLGARAILVATACCLFISTAATAAELVSPAALSDMVTGQGQELATLDSNAAAMALFISKTGSSLGLKDAAGILGAKGISSQMAKDLRLPELAQSTHELMASLTAWQLAESIYRLPSSSPTPTAIVPSAAQQEWMKSTGHLPALPDVLRLLADQPPADSSSAAAQSPNTDLLRAAHQLAVEAQQQALASWWSLSEWKDRVRQARGLARLCGNWQWTLHNHQNHMEQKMAMLFPPPGVTPSDIPLPAETVILGDSIYLRWERNGYVQEDSLLFIQEGHKQDRSKDILRIEGSFVNNTGGWGSIVGKRTAACQP